MKLSDFDHLDLAKYIDSYTQWTDDTFREDRFPNGIIDHMKKELKEIEADPTDIYEYVDMIQLCLGGMHKAGFTPTEICCAIEYKLYMNKRRSWPAKEDQDPNKATEHIK